MPTIVASRPDNLRKQAKRLVRWHREGVRSVAGLMRGLPKFAGRGDADLLAARFTLADALEIVARTAGFPSWKALLTTPISRIPTMSERNTPRITAALPQLFVDDIDAACAWFEQALGFHTAFKHGEPAFYAQVFRDDARLNLRCVQPAPIDRERAQAEALLSAYLLVGNVKQLYVECLERGARIAQPLRRAPWQMDEFVVSDPSGNLILFGEDAA